MAAHMSLAFRPHPLLRSGHSQTIAGYFLPSWSVAYRATPHHVTLDDGDTLVLHDDCPGEWSLDRPTVLLIHGLGGCHGSSYIRRIAGKLNRAGLRTFRMDMRGCGAGARMARHTSHAGRSGDARAAIEHIQQVVPGGPLVACGFSLGANLLLKMLGEAADQPPSNLRLAIAVSPPVNLGACVRHLKSHGNWVYDKYFVRMLRRDFRARKDTLANVQPYMLKCHPRTMEEFDQLITAPLGGFESAEHYFRSASSGPLLSRIEVETQLLVAADDPLIPISIFSRYEMSSKVELMRENHGGHMGFVSASKTNGDRRWMDERIVQWCTAGKPST